MSLKGRRALVTGAGKGIGRAQAVIAALALPPRTFMRDLSLLTTTP